jgi:hypothetical protein
MQRNQAGRDPTAQPIAGGGEIGPFPDQGHGVHLKSVQDQAVAGPKEYGNIHFLQLLQKDQQPFQVGNKSNQPLLLDIQTFRYLADQIKNILRY